MTSTFARSVGIGERRACEVRVSVNNVCIKMSLV